MGVLSDLVHAGAVLVENAVERWTLPYAELRKSEAELAERAGRLQVENVALLTKVAELESELDGLRFNGPTLYADEVKAIEHSLNWVYRGDKHGNGSEVEVLKGLLKRCEPMPLTVSQMDSFVEAGLIDQEKSRPHFGHCSFGHDLHCNANPLKPRTPGQGDCSCSSTPGDYDDIPF